MGALSVFIFVLGAFIVIGYIYLAGVVGDAASKSKRNSLWWIFLSLILTPLVTAIVLIADREK
jgi:hypothetical protein